MSKHPSLNQLNVYREGKGATEFRSAIEHHLQVCVDCKQVYAQLESRSQPLSDQLNAGGNSAARQTASVKPPVLDAPTVLMNHSDFEVLQLLGRGGMGAVYLVKHLITGRLEAIKVLLPHLVTRVDLRKRFLREIQAAAQLDHPNICRTLNALSEKGLLGLVMEYLQGDTLLAVLNKSGPIDYKKACAIAIQICSGIEHASSKGMIHRDLKPANIMLLRNSNRLQVKILDFGLALTTGAEGSDGLTRFGGILGTPEYMAPEQAISPTNVDVRADLYSLGCILYFMLTGQPPFKGETQIAIVQAKLADNATNNLVMEGVPRDLSLLVRQLLSKDPNDRPKDAKSVIAALKTVGVQSRNQAEAVTQAIPADLIQIAKSARPKKKRDQSHSGMFGVFLGVLPTVLLVASVYFYRDKIQELLQMWNHSEANKSTSAIVVRNMPSSVEIWLNDRKTEFLRPDASPNVTVSVLPGRYELALKSTKLNVDVLRKSIDVPAQRDVYIEFDNLLLSRLKKLEATEVIGTNPAVNRADSVASDRNTIQPPTAVPATQLTENELHSIRDKIKEALRGRNVQVARQVLKEYRQSRGSIDDASFGLFELATESLETYLQLLSSSIKSWPVDKLTLVGAQTLKVRVKDQTVIEFSVWPDNGEVKQFPVDQLPLDYEIALVQTGLTISDEDGLRALGLGVITHPEFTASNVGTFARIASRESVIGASSRTSSPLIDCQRLLHDFVVEIADENLQSTIGKLARRFQDDTDDSATMFFFQLEMAKSDQLCLITSNQSARITNLWNIQSGERFDVSASLEDIKAAEQSQNGKVIAVLGGSRDPHLKVFAKTISKPFYQLNELDNRASSITMSTDGRTLAACNSSENFFKWNLQTGKLSSKVVSQQPIGTDNITHSCIAHTMDTVAVANRNGEISVWRTSDGRPVTSFKESSESILQMRFNKRNQLLVVRSNGDLDTYDPTSSNRVSSLRLGRSLLKQFAFSTESNRFVISDILNVVRAWNSDTLECEHVFPAGSSNQILALAIDLAGSALAIKYRSSSIDVWRLN